MLQQSIASCKIYKYKLDKISTALNRQQMLQNLVILGSNGLRSLTQKYNQKDSLRCPYPWENIKIIWKVNESYQRNLWAFVLKKTLAAI